MEVLRYLIVIILAIGTTSAQKKVEVITGRGLFGTWGKWEYCPFSTFATAAQLKFEARQGSGDDTALNGVRLFCGDPADPKTKVITSSVGPWGEWLPLRMVCPHELYAVELKYEQYRPFQDDAGGTNLRFGCIKKDRYESSNGGYETVVLEQPGLGWVWGRWLEYEECKSGEAICGLQTQVEENQGASGDDTAFNGIRIQCCKLPPHKYRY